MTEGLAHGDLINFISVYGGKLMIKSDDYIGWVMIV